MTWSISQTAKERRRETAFLCRQSITSRNEYPRASSLHSTPPCPAPNPPPPSCTPLSVSVNGYLKGMSEIREKVCREVRLDTHSPLRKHRIKHALNTSLSMLKPPPPLQPPFFDTLHSSAPPPPPPPLISYGIKAVTGYHNPISETIALSTSQRTKKPGSELNMHSAD